MIQRLLCLIQGRSTKWPGVRKEFLATHPCCAACGRAKRLEVHHLRPYHLFPSMELDPTNLMTLCASPCHIVFGHCGDWKKFNLYAIVDAATHLSHVEESRK